MRFGLIASALGAALLLSPPEASADLIFNNDFPDGRMATASRPSSAGKIEIESADDFVLTTPMALTSATFTGLIPVGLPLSSIAQVRVEIYRVFPLDSDAGRTPNVNTRVNSPSDVAFAERDNAGVGGLTFTSSVIASTFTANNSVLNGIFKFPNQTTGGDQAVTGQEVRFNVTFTNALNLPADHYFFVPQVQLTTGDFFWLSAPRPIVSPGTPFPAGFTDLQSWIRNENLDPDWSRIGQDIVGGTNFPTFNAAFSLTGVVPEPASLTLMGLGVTGALIIIRLRRRPSTD
jgi:hypothetical protein